MRATILRYPANAGADDLNAVLMMDRTLARAALIRRGAVLIRRGAVLIRRGAVLIRRGAGLIGLTRYRQVGTGTYHAHQDWI